MEDVDPCLFISDKVICLLGVDEFLFCLPKADYDDEMSPIVTKQVDYVHCFVFTRAGIRFPKRNELEMGYCRNAQEILQKVQ